MIRIEKLTKTFGAFRALDGVTFEVKKGETFGLVGPNGAGKTTLLKALVSVVIPTSGNCYISDICVQRDPVAALRQATYLPGDGHFYEFMTARSFIRFAVSGYGDIDIPFRDEMIDLFHIPLDKKIRAFSHGMKRKLGIVQALAPRTPVAILDEPEEGLDPTARIRFAQCVERCRAAGRTIFLSSHQLDSVTQLCGRVAFIAAGKLLDCDSMESIRARASKRIRVRLRKGVDPACLQFDGVASVLPAGENFIVTAAVDEFDILQKLSRLPIDGLEFRQLRLEDIYSDLYQVERES
ncbi:MAG: ABC transporter ATP-binding protein [Planctomycetes bacterium]|nr:ABC transporter ATP-binding protein [Planctomycetota bacterium]